MPRLGDTPCRFNEDLPFREVSDERVALVGLHARGFNEDLPFREVSAQAAYDKAMEAELELQ